MWRLAVIILLVSGRAGAQRVDFPCVPAFRASATYIRMSEVTGGQVFLLQPEELGNPAVALAYARSDHHTLLRASGQLGAGYREFIVPVDGTAESLQFSVWAECVKELLITAPDGAAAEGTSFRSGRLVSVAAPQAGEWRVKVAGTGYFTAVAKAKTQIFWGAPSLTGDLRKGEARNVTFHFSGPVKGVEFGILSRDGKQLALIPATKGETGFNGTFKVPEESFYFSAQGIDETGLAFRRVSPRLYEPKTSP